MTNLEVTQTRPFRAQLPERERSRYKRLVNDVAVPFEERLAYAEILGWLVEVTDPGCAKITTHNGIEFLVHGGKR